MRGNGIESFLIFGKLEALAFTMMLLPELATIEEGTT